MNEVVPFQHGDLVHFERSPSDFGVVCADGEHLIVIWLDDECHVDEIDPDGQITTIRKEGDRKKGQIRYDDGFLYNRQGKRLKRQHPVVCLVRNDPALAAMAKLALDDFLEGEMAWDEHVLSLLSSVAGFDALEDTPADGENCESDEDESYDPYGGDNE